MYFELNAEQKHPQLKSHWSALWANRNSFTARDQEMVAQYNRFLPKEMQMNAQGFKDYWAAFDNQVIELRNQGIGMEIVNDLLQVQTVLDIGKTAKFYNTVGEIAEDVSVSIDGQAPYSFDHTQYDGDADPIPVITAGWGVNWRHFRGLQTEGFDLMMDSQRAKMRVYNDKLVDIVLNGAANIQVQSYASQGLRNHRNTKKIDLTTAGSGGGNINLATATAAELIAFFQGPFATLLRANRIPELDILWVSDEVGVNLGKVYVENGVTVGTVQDYLLRFIKVKEIRSTYALVGNEAVGYVRNRDVVTPLVGMATSVQMLPRPMPEHNYNARVIGAMGLQVKADAQGLGGVVFMANLT
ncbi:hypothetical protein D3C77_325850 [compost metagenome]